MNKKGFRSLVEGLPPAYWLIWAGTLINRLGGFVIHMGVECVTGEMGKMFNIVQRHSSRRRCQRITDMEIAHLFAERVAGERPFGHAGYILAGNGGEHIGCRLDRGTLHIMFDATHPAHFFAAASYSLAGLRRLAQESAFRQEVLLGVVVVGGLLLWGANLPQVLGAVALVLLLVAVEALNTALEEVVDHLSPGWSQFAKNAKDLGSLAVACTIGVLLLYVLVVLVWG